MQQNEFEAIKTLDKFKGALLGCDTIKFILTGVGEEAFTTREISEALNFYENKFINKIDKLQKENEQLKNKLSIAVEDLSGHCEYCTFRGDCAKHDNNDTTTGVTWWTDCEDWIWRGEAQNENN